jgi:hypothetical protein
MVRLEANQKDRKWIVEHLQGTKLVIPLFSDMQHIDEFKKHFPEPIIQRTNNSPYTNDATALLLEMMILKLDTLWTLGTPCSKAL